MSEDLPNAIDLDHPRYAFVRDCCVHCRTLYATHSCPHCGWVSPRTRRWARRAADAE